MIEIVNLPHDLSLKFERLNFEYQAKLRVLKYLIDNCENKQANLINQLKEEAENKNIELVLFKNELMKNYPSKNKYQYFYFNYDENAIYYSDEKFEVI